MEKVYSRTSGHDAIEILRECFSGLDAHAATKGAADKV
jgi:hypothetical protein